jgi:probable HAF family extracellular repeat protein
MMKRTAQNRFKALTSACVLSMMATVAWSQSLTWLGTLGGDESRAYGVSANGVVVGWADTAWQRRAFRWENGVMQDLGTLGGLWSEAYGVSANGSVVVGWSLNADGQKRAFRWENGVMQDLGTLGGGWSAAYGVSADGSVVVGWADDADWQGRAFRWENGVMQDLDTLGGYGSEAWGVSADGAVVVCTAFYYDEDYYHYYARAFRWTASGGMQYLGTLPGGDWIEAYGVSANGAVVVGWAENADWQKRAFRWQNGVMQDLGTLGGDESEAYGVSADGSVVVGWADDADWQRRAFRWTASGGMEDLNLTYASLLTNGSVLIEARAISPDGRYIVGWGYNAATGRFEAFLLDTGPRCTTHNGDVDANGCVDDADLLAVLFNFGNSGNNLGREDTNCDGTVDDADLLQVLFNFGSGC